MTTTLTPTAPIAKVALYFTAPSYWLDGHSDKLRDFLRFIFDPTNPGLAALGVQPEEGSNRTDNELLWLEGGDALARVSWYHEQVWSPADSQMKNIDGNSDLLFRHLVETKSVVFIDHNRFETCCAALLVDKDGKEPHIRTTSVAPYWIGLSIDWAKWHDIVTWAPQFRVYSYWPESRAFSPSPSDNPQPLPSDRFSADTAAALLENVYWLDIETKFRRLRDHFELGTADTGSFESPVFYIVEPTSTPPMPDLYLQSQWRSVLASFTQYNLGVSDPFADKMVTSILEGRLAVLSYAIHSLRSGVLQDYYLILPADAMPGDDPSVRENNLSYVTDQLAYIHFYAAKTAVEVTARGDIVRQRMRVQSAILEHAKEIAERILTTVSASGRVDLEGTEGGLRGLAREFQLVVERLKLRFTQIDLNIQQLRAELANDRSTNADFLTRKLATRKARSGRNLSGAMMAPSVIAADALDSLSHESADEVRNLEELKATFDGVFAHVERNDREGDERGQKMFSYLLGFLAAVVAFPLLIGHMSWLELGTVLNRHSMFGGLVWTTHAVVTWISVIAAAAGIVMLLLYLVIRSERTRRMLNARLARLQKLHESPKEIAAIWLDVSEGTALGQDSKAASSYSDLDRDIMAALAAESTWLLENAIDPQDGSPVRDLRTRVMLIGALSELFLQRPSPLPLPSTLLFIRSCGPRFFGEWVGSETVNDVELEYVLTTHGFSIDQARALAERTASKTWMQSVQSVEELVSAVEAILLTEQPRPVGEAAPKSLAIEERQSGSRVN